jgi:hypothetical protein
MGIMFASCGHVIEWEWFISNSLVKVKRYNRELQPAISLEVLCPECVKELEERKQILTTEEEIKSWLNGKSLHD